MQAEAGIEGRVLLRDLVEEWWASRPRLAPTTQVNYRNLEKHILPVLGGKRVDEIRPRLVGQFLRKLEDDDDLAPGTVRKVRTVFSAVMSYAVAMEYAEDQGVGTGRASAPQPVGDPAPAPGFSKAGAPGGAGTSRIDDNCDEGGTAAGNSASIGALKEVVTEAPTESAPAGLPEAADTGDVHPGGHVPGSPVAPAPPGTPATLSAPSGETAPASPTPAPAASPAVRRTTMVAVLAVALAAAASSYDHLRVLADLAGEGWRSLLLPVSVDGLVVAASMSMLVRRRAGEPAGLLAWLALSLGLGASLAGNVVAADPGLVDPVLVKRVVAAWPPLALAIAYELFLGIRQASSGVSAL